MKKVFPLYDYKHYGPDHHMWENNGTWWAHYSVTRVRGRSKRMRVSLCTKSRKVARQRRDQLFKTHPDKVKVLVQKWRDS
jgi:hypothetical protein